ncbi:helix-turn-helix domain-containing protein [Streptomyces sp. NPDC002057]|uniref:AraC-like ligand-binding domain-containing protein n=1 Tax=Streptomyces sp. NPDC002057 TaxID=3154664 RepID=UPI003324313C
MHTVRSTASVPVADRPEWWQQGVRHWLAPLRVLPVGARSCTGLLRADDLGYVRMVSIEAGPMRISRTPRLVATAPDDRLVLAAQTRGTAALHQNGRSVLVEQGGLALLDLRRPFALDQRTEFRTLLLRLPRPGLGASASRVDRVTGKAFPTTGGVGAVIGAFVAGLDACAAGASPAVRDCLGGQLTDLIATWIDEAAEDPGAGRDQHLPHRNGLQHRIHLLARIRGFIDERLRDPGLSPSVIAENHRISLRSLHHLFEAEETTVCRLIKRRRLEECARELARRGDDRTLTAVAQGWGFRSPAHFSRSFKEAYGHAPRHARPDGPPVTVRTSSG